MTIQNLTPAKKKKLRQILAEMKARGMEIPDEMKEEMKGGTRKIIWHKDSNGYFTKMDGNRYNALPIHEGFIKSNALFVALIGGRGVGKSSAGAQKMMMKVSEGKSGVVMNPDFENFKISTWQEMKQWIQWDAVVHRQMHRRNPEWYPTQPFKMAFQNGVEVFCKGVKDPESARGSNVNWFWYDEGGRDETGDSFRIAIPSVRVGDDPQIFVTGTPNGDMHWMSKLFVDKEVPDAVHEALEGLAKERKLIELFAGTTMDNRENLSDSTMAIILSLYQEGTWLYEQEILGKVVTQGSGALGNRAWFDGKVLYERQSGVRRRVRYWDLAATEKKAISQKRYTDPDETVGTLMSFKKLEDGTLEFYIEDQVCGHWEWDDILENITKTAINDGQYVEIWVEQEPASGGKNQVAAVHNHVRDNLPGWRKVEGHNPRELGDKVMRANHWFSEAAQGNIYLIAGEWNEPFLQQLSSFPLVKHDDKVDSVSGARAVLAPIKKWKSIPFMRL